MYELLVNTRTDAAAFDKSLLLWPRDIQQYFEMRLMANEL